MSLFETVYYLNRKHLLSFSAEKDAIESCCVEMFNDYRSALRVDSTHHSFYDLEMNWDVQIYGFLDFYASLEPINDENFEPMFEVDSKGNISFIYPEIDTTYYGFVSIPEIRIEERMNTELDYFYEIPYETGMQIEQFGFTAFDYSGRPELFWVNYNLFRIAMKKVILKPKIFRGMTC